MGQKALARWLKLILCGVGLCGAAVYFGFFPSMGSSLAAYYPEFSDRYWPWLIFLWGSGIPCYLVLGLGFRIARNIGEDRSFSRANAEYLKWIAYLAAGDGVYFFLGNVILWLTDMSHPGMALASLLVVFAGVSVTVAAAVLSHLVQKAADLEEQSELTI